MTEIEAVDLDIANEQELVALAVQIEQEAAAEYDRLAAEMRSHDNEETALLFERLAAEERGHEAALIKHHSDPEDGGATGLWDNPVELLITRKPGDPYLLTPYEAISYALHNEKKGLDLFIHLASHAENDAVRSLAETFAKEEISHIVSLRAARLQASRELRELRSELGWWRDPAGLHTERELEDHCRAIEAHACAVYTDGAAMLEESLNDGGYRLLCELAEESQQTSNGISGAGIHRPAFIQAADTPQQVMIAMLRFTDQILEFMTLAAEKAADDALYHALSGRMEYYADRLARIRKHLAA